MIHMYSTDPTRARKKEHTKIITAQVMETKSDPQGKEAVEEKWGDPSFASIDDPGQKQICSVHVQPRDLKRVLLCRLSPMGRDGLVQLGFRPTIPRFRPSLQRLCRYLHGSKTHQCQTGHLQRALILTTVQTSPRVCQQHLRSIACYSVYQGPLHLQPDPDPEVFYPRQH